jgi:formylglycine-generating enzyme required for sulfatase activity
MEITRQLRCYISSTSLGLTPYRAKAFEAVQRLGQYPVGMESYNAEDIVPVERCVHDVRGCDVYIGIFIPRLGYVPPGESRSMTQIEYATACEEGKPTLLFLWKEPPPWPGPTDEGELGRAQRRFLQQVRTTKLVDFFGSEDELAYKITASLAQHLVSSGWAGGLCEPPQMTGPVKIAQEHVLDGSDRSRSGPSWAETLGLRFRLIPPGRFLLGAPENDPSARADERPRSPVEIRNPLWVAVFPLTNGAARQLFEAPEAAQDPDLGPLVADQSFARSARDLAADDQAPVTEISCNDAERIARFLARRDGLAYRLPTEAEWEYLARAGASGGVWWPDDRPARQLVVDGRGPRPAGAERSNAWGLIDVLGNVEEWTSSAYVTPLDPRAAARPAGPLDREARTVRGGSWRDAPEVLRLYRRSSRHRAKRCDFIGTRLVCEVSELARE